MQTKRQKAIVQLEADMEEISTMVRASIMTHTDSVNSGDIDAIQQSWMRTVSHLIAHMEVNTRFIKFVMENSIPKPDPGI